MILIAGIHGDARDAIINAAASSTRRAPRNGRLTPSVAAGRRPLGINRNVIQAPSSMICRRRCRRGNHRRQLMSAASAGGDNVSPRAMAYHYQSNGLTGTASSMGTS